jgi:hypothetical protein
MPGTSEAFSFKAVVDFYGPAELMLFPEAMMQNHRRASNWCSPACTSRFSQSCQPVTYVDKNDPPFLIIHGEKDELVSTRHSSY